MIIIKQPKGGDKSKDHPLGRSKYCYAEEKHYKDDRKLLHKMIIILRAESRARFSIARFQKETFFLGYDCFMGRGQGGEAGDVLANSSSVAEIVLAKSENENGKLHSENGRWSLMVPSLKDIDIVSLDEMIADSGEDLDFLEEGEDKDAARIDFIAALVEDFAGPNNGQPYNGDALIQWHHDGDLVAEIDESGEFRFYDFDGQGEFVVSLDDESFVAVDGKFQG